MPQARRREPFAFRLFLGVALTLLASGAFTFVLVDARLRSQLMDSASADVTRELDRYERERRGSVRGLTHRLWGVEGVRNVSVQAVPPPGPLTTEIVEGAHGERVLRVLAPVRSGRFIHTLTVEREAHAFGSVLFAVRESMLVIAVPALLGSLVLFWLLAGRALHARHRFAVERATRDGLTDLGNHRAFQDELRRATATAERDGNDFALAVFDVDDFKFLNDRRGHQKGDDLLRTVARLLASTRGQDRAFRTGGDEFALIMPSTDEHGGMTASTRIRRLAREAGVAVSCGVTATRPGMRSPELLREEAEAALQEAKSRRAELPVKFSEVSGRAAILTSEKAHAVRLMLRDSALDVAVQPIWDLERGGFIGFEGLARPLPDYGIAGPAEAFDVAEQIGRIGDLDRLCVQRILEQAPQLPGDARLFINVHPASLDGDGEGGEWLMDALHRARVSTDRVVIEVTERSGARVSAIVRSVKQLRELGLRVALDDVGAGNSGLQMMHSVAVDYLKVDRSVVVRAAQERGARAVLAAILAFAHESGTFVIAEGIEDVETLRFVRSVEVHAPNGIAGGQGYGLGRPVSSVTEAVARSTPPSTLDGPGTGLPSAA